MKTKNLSPVLAVAVFAIGGTAILFLIIRSIEPSSKKTGPAEHAASGVADPTAPLVRPSYNPNATYRGATARTWGERAMDRDFGTSDQAVDALDNLGEDGVPYLVEIVKRKHSTYINAIMALSTKSTAAAYADVLVPVLRPMLKNKIEAVQAARLCDHLGKAAAPLVAELKAASNSDNQFQNQWAKGALAKINR